MREIPAVDPREVKLPVWARDQLNTLRRIAQDARDEADEARLATKPEDTDTLINRYAEIPIGLPKGETVRFIVGADREHHWIDVHMIDGGIELMGGDSLRIMPWVTNVVKVSLDR